jgi:phage baseplate assembly protein W
MANIFGGIPYPTRKTPRGYWYSQQGADQIKSDLLCLLLTNPGERVMLPEFGTPLKQLLFEQNDSFLRQEAQRVIAQAISLWEPRIVVQKIEVSSNPDDSSLNSDDDGTQREHILMVKIIFVDPQNIKEVQQLVLEVPLS